MTNNTYVVATIKPWNISQFKTEVDSLPGNWLFVGSRDQLTIEWLNKIKPRYIFFPHWSWVVIDEVLDNFECVCFHMADVPYGRGGSPLQNLIMAGHNDTKLTALRMVKELDAGPVYKKIPLSLEGTAGQIFERMAPKIYELIRYIILNEPEPIQQVGEVTTFKRRTPVQSKLPNSGSLQEVFNHIRMLDAETYPNAYLNNGEFRLEFDHADFHGDEVIARVVISRKS